MIRKIKVPGVGYVEIDLTSHPSVKLGTLHVTRMTDKFFTIKYREYHDPTDLQLIAGIKGHISEERSYHQLEEKKRKVREEDGNPIAGHINRHIQ